MEKIEFIEEYIRTDKSSDYQWNDNHGVLIRCKDCKHWIEKDCVCNFHSNGRAYDAGDYCDEDDYCSWAKRKEE